MKDCEHKRLREQEQEKCLMCLEIFCQVCAALDRGLENCAPFLCFCSRECIHAQETKDLLQ